MTPQGILGTIPRRLIVETQTWNEFFIRRLGFESKRAIQFKSWKAHPLIWNIYICRHIIWYLWSILFCLLTYQSNSNFQKKNGWIIYKLNVLFKSLKYIGYNISINPNNNNDISSNPQSILKMVGINHFLSNFHLQF